MFDLMMFCYYLKRFRGSKQISFINKLTVIVGLTAIWEFIIFLHRPHLSLVTFIIVLMIISKMYEGDLHYKIFMLLSYLIICILIKCFGTFLWDMFKSNGLTTNKGILYFCGIFLEYIRVCIVMLICKLYGNDKICLCKVPNRIKGTFFFIFCSMIMICNIFLEILFEAEDMCGISLCMLVIISAVSVCHHVVIMMKQFMDLSDRQIENERYICDLKYQKILYEEMQQAYDEIKKLKHDLKNRLLHYEYLIDTNEISEIKSQLLDISNSLDMADNHIFSSNPILNSVLRNKHANAEKKNIKVNFDISVPAKLNLDNGDMGVIYGNLFDNAIEACEKMDIEKRFINITSRVLNGNLFIKLQNSKCQKSNPELKTTKCDRENHGIGIKSVSRLVEKYNGKIMFEDKIDYFEVYAVLLDVVGE